MNFAIPLNVVGNKHAVSDQIKDSFLTIIYNALKLNTEKALVNYFFASENAKTSPTSET
ncbi:MAG: hypothetical protein K0Q79_3486 [Flavipsychrobacter sp.]|jgi:hypothetical protein|nr:hypothetical protein [Flavipsychrobacter sp.]